MSGPLKGGSERAHRAGALGVAIRHCKNVVDFDMLVKQVDDVA